MLATVRFSPRAGVLPRIEPRRVDRCPLLEARPMSGAPTTEQKIRGGDATADWVLLVGGYDAEALKSGLPDGIVNLYRPAYSLSAGEIA